MSKLQRTAYWEFFLSYSTVLLPCHLFSLPNAHRNLKLTLAFTCEPSRVKGNINSWHDFSNSPCDQQPLPHSLPPNAVHYGPLTSDPCGLPQTPLFWFELANLALVQETQSTPPQTHNMPHYPASLCFHSALISPWGLWRYAMYLFQDLWIINCSISVPFVICCWTTRFTIPHLARHLVRINLTNY